MANVTGYGDPAWEILERRIALMEGLVFGPNPPETVEQTIQSKLTELTEKFASIDKKVPELQACVDMLMNQFPSLIAKRGGVKHLVERTEEIHQQKEQLAIYIANMEKIKELESHIDGFDEDKIERMKEKLCSLDALYADIKKAMDVQSKELDEIVDIYEKTVLLVNKACATWEWRLQEQSQALSPSSDNS